MISRGFGSPKDQPTTNDSRESAKDMATNMLETPDRSRSRVPVTHESINWAHQHPWDPVTKTSSRCLVAFDRYENDHNWWVRACTACVPAHYNICTH